ncbi:hypothetical protein BpHYR1_024701 [Brachionus plicatilis]|uniref:Uncharacterized protein n=1 Tax=Brachionus plicatilis TaxID=10195 RepID=A0A3M7SBB9_BRAPC|nr:hypothetical protein BpHYR1_024701 [Brachionus plicatilis]
MAFGLFEIGCDLAFVMFIKFLTIIFFKILNIYLFLLNIEQQRQGNSMKLFLSKKKREKFKFFLNFNIKRASISSDKIA